MGRGLWAEGTRSEIQRERERERERGRERTHVHSHALRGESAWGEGSGRIRETVDKGEVESQQRGEGLGPDMGGHRSGGWLRSLEEHKGWGGKQGGQGTVGSGRERKERKRGTED